MGAGVATGGAAVGAEAAELQSAAAVYDALVKLRSNLRREGRLAGQDDGWNRRLTADVKVEA